ncbi:hypothetical protein EWH23_12990 [Meiothermus sp. PNK-Is4]|nr:hypothetical protein EWH23_12990 [Meiothermus sp. PNK-Is4]
MLKHRRGRCCIARWHDLQFGSSPAILGSWHGLTESPEAELRPGLWGPRALPAKRDGGFSCSRSSRRVGNNTAPNPGLSFGWRSSRPSPGRPWSSTR